MKKREAVDISFSNHRVIYFLVFLISNSLLSYSSIPFTAKLWVFLIGLALPLALALKTLTPFRKSEVPVWNWDLLGSSSAKFWILIGLLFLGARYAQLTLFSGWPIPDDGAIAIHSTKLSEEWSWRFLFTQVKAPPLVYACLGLFFKVFPPSLFSMKLFPVLCFFLVTAAAYWSIRRFFQKSFGTLLFILLTFSFWPLFTEKYCSWMILFLFWEILSFGLLAVFLKSKPGREERKTAMMLGTCLGLGLFIYLASPLVAFVVILGSYRKLKTAWRGNRNVVYGLFGPVIACGALYVLISILKGIDKYVGSLWAFYPGMDFQQQTIDSLSHFTGLFWGGDFKALYGPVWGGMLNPLLASAFFMGFLELVRFRSSPFAKWVLLGLGLFLTPGLVTISREIFRVLQILPLLLLVCAVGIQSLASALPGRRRLVFVALLLIGSSGLDFNHLWKSCHETGGATETGYFQRAYQILKKINQDRGMGALYFDTRIHVSDQTLTIATYRFDAARNPKLSFSDAKWVAIIVNVNYEPFLKERFPKSDWFPIFEEADHPGSEGKWVLGIIPIDADNREALTRWREADRVFRELVLAVANGPKEQQSKVFQRLAGIYGAARGDRLLESVYWGMVYAAHNWEASFGDRDKARHFVEVLSAVQNIVEKGYPAAHSLNELGELRVIKGDYTGAREAFLKALHAPVNYTSARENLKALDEMLAARQKGTR